MCIFLRARILSCSSVPEPFSEDRSLPTQQGGFQRTPDGLSPPIEKNSPSPKPSTQERSRGRRSPKAICSGTETWDEQTPRAPIQGSPHLVLSTKTRTCLLVLKRQKEVPAYTARAKLPPSSHSSSSYSSPGPEVASQGGTLVIRNGGSRPV